VTTEPRHIDFSLLTPTSHDPGVSDSETHVGGTRWALVVYEPGAGREEGCETPHSGIVLCGTLTYSFEDGRAPLTLGPGDGFALPESPRHRGRNDGSEPTRLFIIDALN